ncbi:hypothetical protein ACFU5O_34830 [Streptomyces sp. NPDC057445]|uniref:Rv1733c family protein n=1 Tax=Streptomyces sp. NPDC057445 TaxID=3346136 RepID=UPI00369989AD
MRAITGIWRWRHNPLCRATDLLEAWAALTAALLLTVAAPAVGWLCGALADDALGESVRAQRAERHVTTARVLGAAPGPENSLGGDPDPAERRGRRLVVAEWTGVDGGRRSGMVVTSARTADPGDAFRIWTDDRGNHVNRPMEPGTARAHAALAGLTAAAATAGVVEAGRRLFVRRLIQRRYTRLDRAWAKAGPDWGRTGTGS